jgi:predicted dinucleotide-binding enzyme
MGYHDLDEGAHATPRKAIAIAGEPAAAERVAKIVDAFGFDPVLAGPLAEGKRLEPGTETFGANVDATELQAMLTRYPQTVRGQEVARSREAA